MAKAKSAAGTSSTAQSEQEKRQERAAKRVAKFKDAAPKRVRVALRTLDKVCQLANRGRYTFDEDQAKKIVEAISSRVEKIRQAFTSSDPAKEEFIL